MYTNEFKLRVRYEETDRMGIVYHANYITWFEIGRTEYLRSIGYTYRDMENSIWIPVVSVECRYKKPARYDDLVTIKTHIIELHRVKAKFGYEVLKDNEVIAVGTSINAFTSPELKPLALNKVKPDLFKKLEECAECCKF
jgi:acyl-CoA thioester hydrolase